MVLNITARKKTGEDYLPVETVGIQAETRILSGDGTIKNPFREEVRLKNPSDAKWKGVVHIELLFPKENPRFFLPGFMYGRNRGETPLNAANEYPRLREGECMRPASPWWLVRSDRLSHPAAFACDNGRLYGLTAGPYMLEKNGNKYLWHPGDTGEFFQYSGFSCSLEKGSIGYTLGYENAPWHFIQSHRVVERQKMNQNCLTLEAGEEILFTMNFYDYPINEEREIYEAIQTVYEEYHEPPRKGTDIRTTIRDISKAVYRDAWLPEDRCYSGFVYDMGDKGLRYNKIFSISWTNGLSVAVPMLEAAHRLGDEAMRNQAIECIENIVHHSLNPATGLPFETCGEDGWSNHGWWFDGMHTAGHTSYLSGQSAYYLIKAYDYEIRLKNTRHPEWLAFAGGVLEKLEKTKNSDYEYPYIISEKTGAGLEYDAMAGAWCMAAMAYYIMMTQDTACLKELKASEKHYYDSFVKLAECYGGPLDTDKTIDSEGILAYIRGVRILHEITGEDQYLDHLRDALCYEFSFKFCYNSPIKIPPLGRIGWSSCGGSITSVANPHIHPMSSTVIDEILYYVRKRKDTYIESRLMDTVGWSCQTYNTYDKEYDYGRKGWMSERFCHCEGLLVQEYPDGSVAGTWFALMPWACGSILEGLSGEWWEYQDQRVIKI